MIRRLPRTNQYGHLLRPLRQRLWHKIRYWGIPISPYLMPPCPYDEEHQ